jgi:hypothetical protein
VSYRLLVRGECKDYNYDYFVINGGAFVVMKGDYITFYNGWRWFRGYFLGYTLRVCRRWYGNFERIGFVRMLVYEDFKWREVLVRFKDVYGVGMVVRNGVVVFPA